jgi:hypothetical protein
LKARVRASNVCYQRRGVAATPSANCRIGFSNRKEHKEKKRKNAKEGLGKGKKETDFLFLLSLLFALFLSAVLCDLCG